MDNPQQYQPLSHALNPPIVQPQYEEEDEEEEGDDEGAVEEQLERDDDDGDDRVGPNSASHQTPSAIAVGKQRQVSSSVHQQQSNGQPALDDSDRKRRPGRPRGSKNRRPRTSGPDVSNNNTPPTTARPSSNSQHGFYQYSSPPAPGEVHPHNQQYYEFQWRVLNLCAEFYGAAEELVKATPPFVIAQCYHMGPTVKVDPLTMVSEAKRICDALLASPARLTTQPPPPPLTFIPSYPPTITPQPPRTPPASTNGKTTPVAQSTPPVITNPQSFVVPMSHHQPSSQQFVPSVYNSPAYPTAPYYGYGGYSGYYQPTQQAGPSTTSLTPPASASAINSAGNQGAWSDEETEKLKKLAEEHRNNGGDIAWDALCEKWGNSRTRHQILIKATSLGLKESSSRGTKRRRDTESGSDRHPPPPAASIPPNTNHIATPVPTSASAPPPQQNAQPTQSAIVSPASSTPAPSTQPSPAIRHAHTQQMQQQSPHQPSHQQPPHQPQHQPSSHQQPQHQPSPHQQSQHPPSSLQQPQHQQSPHQQHQLPPPAPSRFPYPMPTVAAATSPVISPNTTQQQQDNRQTTVNTYYRRQNPTAPGSKPASQAHGHAGVGAPQYIYQPNGRREA